MGLRPKPRKLLKKLDQNFHRESFLLIYIVSSTMILRKIVRLNVILCVILSEENITV